MAKERTKEHQDSCEKCLQERRASLRKSRTITGTFKKELHGRS